jgi:hypothetical protein
MEITHKEHQSLEHQSGQSAYAVWEDQSALLPDVYTLNVSSEGSIFAVHKKLC